MWIGTGWFIGPHTLMTAGHVVYIKNSGVPGRDGWVRSIQVMPGRNGSDAALRLGHQHELPLRRGLDQQRRREATTTARSSSPPTSATPRAGSGSGSTPTPTAHRRDRQHLRLSGRQAGRHAVVRRARIASVTARKVYYDIDTAGGQSGSAVYRIINGKRYGVRDPRLRRRHDELGTRIVTPVYNNMVAWKA